MRTMPAWASSLSGLRRWPSQFPPGQRGRRGRGLWCLTPQRTSGGVVAGSAGFLHGQGAGVEPMRVRVVAPTSLAPIRVGRRPSWALLPLVLAALLFWLASTEAHAAGVSLRAPQGVVLPGDRIAVSATAARPGRAVLERLGPKRLWVRVGQRPVQAGRAFSISFRQAGAGRVRLRVRVLAGRRVVASSRPISVRVRAQGRRVVPRRPTLTLPPSAARTVSGDPDGRQRVTLPAGMPAPARGRALVANASASSPGLLAIVTASRRNPSGTTTVTTRPAALDEVYRDYKVVASLGLPPAPLGAQALLGGQRPFARENALLPISCTGSGPSPVTLTTDFHRQARVDLNLDVGQRAIQFFYRSRPLTTLTLRAGASQRCTLDQSARERLTVTLPIPGTPLVVRVAPAAEATFSAQMNGEVTLETEVLMVFDRSPANAQNTFIATPRSPSVRIDANANATANLFVGGSLDLSVAGRAGIIGEFGPAFGIEARPEPGRLCASADAALRVQLSVFADVFFRRFTFSLPRGTFGKRQFFSDCLPLGPAAPAPGDSPSPAPQPPGPGPAAPGGPASPAPQPPGIPMDEPPPGGANPGGGGPTGGPTPRSGTVAAGAFHTCALRPGGTVSCWGLNHHGQLGDGTLVSTNAAVSVAGLSGVSRIAAGGRHTCALLLGGTVACWGDNSSGQLGHLGVSTATPTIVEGLTDVTAIAAGGTHTCALRGSGTISCWGDNGSGQLGNGRDFDETTRPTDVGGIVGALGVSAGSDHTCAVISDRSLACWGSNTFGELGTTPAGFFTSTGLPTAVPGVSGVQNVASGSDYTCALHLNGTATCWGNNSVGQLGHGTMGGSAGPAAVVALPHSRTVTTGVTASCALVASGRATCWGSNRFGALGNGSGVNSSVPVPVSSLTDLIDISSGQPAGSIVTGSRVCAIQIDFEVWCWGSNVFGGVGDGTNADAPLPRRVVGNL